MDPRPCIYRAPLELDRVDVVRRVSGCDHGPSMCSLDRHLWIEFCDRACRLVTRCVCDIVFRPDFGAPPLDAGHRSGIVGADTRRRRNCSVKYIANRYPRNWLRIVQPSIPQTIKWKPATAEANLQTLLKLSGTTSPRPIAAIIWPEAATPFLLEREAAVRQKIAAVVPDQGYLITGALRASPSSGPVVHIWNSIEALNAEGDIVGRYDKAHLVPFGEYFPFQDVLPFKKITSGAIDLSAGPGPRTIALPRLPPFAAAICYEAIFPGAIVDEQDRPDWILNLTNDAWYGRSSGPFQHLASARTRSVEEGLPMVRVANNGISAVIDATGRVRTRINLDTIGYADVVLPAPGERTLYSRAGDWTLLVLLLLGSLPVVFRRR